MSLDKKLSNGEAMALYVGLAIGTVLGGATCARKQNQIQQNPVQIEQTVESGINPQENNQLVISEENCNYLSNRPFRYGNDVYLYEDYNRSTRMFSFRFNDGRTYLSLDQFNGIPWNNVRFMSMSAYQGYFPGYNGGMRMTTRPPAQIRYWNNINRSMQRFNQVPQHRGRHK